MALGQARYKRVCRLSAAAAVFASCAAAMPASAFQPRTADDLDLFVAVGRARLASVTTGRGWGNIAPGANWRSYDDEPRKLPSMAPVWNVTEHGARPLESTIFVDPERAARAVLGYVEIGATYSPFKDLDFGIGFVRNPKDGALSAMVFTMGVSARY